jgi:excisionase family DNA binding protein
MPQNPLDRKRVIESIVRLRRAERASDQQTRRDLEPVIAFLEDAAGPTVRRAEAARLLGISYPALDRWIAKGDIAAVMTPSGRKEIPLPQLVDLVAELDSHQVEGRLALASIIRERRRKAAQIAEEEFMPPRRRQPRTHRTPELHALAYHRLVAKRLDENVVDQARKRLGRWEQSGRIHPRWHHDWERVLAMPIPRIARLISSDKRARELRQTSPFAGVLNEQERRRVLGAVKDHAGP